MSKTIRKLASELHITKQAIYQRMDVIDNFRNKYTTMIGNRIMVNESGEKLIKNFEQLDKYNQEKQQESHQIREDDDFSVLKKQLNIKDDQISKLLSEFTKQQELYEDALKEIKVLRDRIKTNNGHEHHRHWGLWR